MKENDGTVDLPKRLVFDMLPPSTIVGMELLRAARAVRAMKGNAE
jgi:hypothetical protein